MKFSRTPYGLDVYVGPYCGRISWSRSGSFGWHVNDGPVTRFIRRWWSGWFRWDDDSWWDGN